MGRRLCYESIQGNAGAFHARALWDGSIVYGDAGLGVGPDAGESVFRLVRSNNVHLGFVGVDAVQVLLPEHPKEKHGKSVVSEIVAAGEEQGRSYCSQSEGIPDPPFPYLSFMQDCLAPAQEKREAHGGVPQVPQFLQGPDFVLREEENTILIGGYL